MTATRPSRALARLAGEAELIRRLGLMLDASFTTAGHLAMRNTRESRGECSWKTCAPGCRAARLLLIEAAEYLAGDAPMFTEPVTVETPAATQPDLFAALLPEHQAGPAPEMGRVG